MLSVDGTSRPRAQCVVQGKAGMGMYSQFEKDRDQGNFDLLPELHAILSGMKVGHAREPYLL